MVRRRSKRETYEDEERVAGGSGGPPASEQIPGIAEETAPQAFAQALANTEAEDEPGGLAYALASQDILARDWSTPEDDVDWQDWIIPTEDKE